MSCGQFFANFKSQAAKCLIRSLQFSDRLVWHLWDVQTVPPTRYREWPGNWLCRRL